MIFNTPRRVKYHHISMQQSSQRNQAFTLSWRCSGSSSSGECGGGGGSDRPTPAVFSLSFITQLHAARCCFLEWTICAAVIPGNKMSETGVLDNSYMSLTVVSFLAFMFVYEYVSPWISSWLCPKYKTLTEKQQINWNTRVISSVHAVIMGSLCLYTINYDPEVRDDPIWRDTPQVRVSGAILIGYSLAAVGEDGTGGGWLVTHP
ncbi:Hypothetical predicted protein [Octopus vulgaris]|uniref:TLC domain-containing protein n=1 Tax=Octopus vulgaris TaxID=6645 RepID=A0AA36B4J3_OCTVU|nr:Hypothetical predicted protein [Octopus vulgaris]